MHDEPASSGDALASTAGTARPARRRLARFTIVAAVCVLLAFVLGFLVFAARIVDLTVPTDPYAQGIVVLTGGTARIDGALQLLAERRASRLLISGVNPLVTRQTLAGTVPSDLDRMLACCVDLDHAALDTIGNATETRTWAEAKGFRSLIVVTSDYHMPRSMVELAAAMPDIRLIPYPVVNPDLHLADWWRNPAAFSLLLREYGKFLLAEARRPLAFAIPPTR